MERKRSKKEKKERKRKGRQAEGKYRTANLLLQHYYVSNYVIFNGSI
jgi:hypothetical protein